MKLKFKYQQFQVDAAKAVCDIFSGQIKGRLDYLIDPGNRNTLYQERGFGNHKLTLDDSQLLKNIHEVQKQHGIKTDSQIAKLNDVPVLSVEMETGTGKTYTYIKTMYELFAQYGWSKFVIVVPSIAIREGVLKTFQITSDHFASEYGKRMKYFVYNSDRLSELQVFASDAGLNVMIINTQAFNRDFDNTKIAAKTNKKSASLKIFTRQDSFASRRPIDVIAAAKPILIIDEPQSVLGSDDKKNKTRKNISQFNPLFIVNYSATHRENFNMVYRLDAIDAYQKNLVKKIIVKGIKVIGDNATSGYLYVQKINIYPNKNPDVIMSFKKDFVSQKGGIKTTTKTLHEQDNIYDHSGELEAYHDGYVIRAINKRDNTVTLSNGLVLHEGEVIGDANEEDKRRIQIRETILSHLEKEKELYKKGIKCLSLFFIDEVAKYKTYENGEEKPGLYWKIFEEEYQNAVHHFLQGLPLDDDKYQKFLSHCDVHHTHNGYFSIDKKGHAVDSSVKRGETISDDISAYELIMKNKERLLSFKEQTRFIFTHSALREGWDNPNVFQICTLRESSADIKKHQELGRGLRLCVNQDGNRMDEEVLGKDLAHETNQLTVIANESYEDFAKELQNELAEIINKRPRQIDADFFNGCRLIDSAGEEKEVNHNEASKLYVRLIDNKIVDEQTNQLTDDFSGLNSDSQLVKIQKALGTDYAPYIENIQKRLLSVFDEKKNQMVENGRNKTNLNLDRKKYDSATFNELWSKMNRKTFYTVKFDEDQLIQKCILALNYELNVTQTHAVITTGFLKKNDLDTPEMRKLVGRDEILQSITSSSITYDLLGEIARQTSLTRKCVAKILSKISADKFHCFHLNPEEFIHECCRIINAQKAEVIVENVIYQRLDDIWDKDDIFANDIINGKYHENICDTPRHHLYDKLRFDSEIEKKFAEELEIKEDIELFVKLPKKFFIDTPAGKYNPDWAIAFKKGAVRHVYIIAETKGNSGQQMLRQVENAKIACARKHFAAISGDNLKFGVVSNYEELYKEVMNQTSDENI